MSSLCLPCPARRGVSAIRFATRDTFAPCVDGGSLRSTCGSTSDSGVTEGRSFRDRSRTTVTARACKSFADHFGELLLAGLPRGYPPGRILQYLNHAHHYLSAKPSFRASSTIWRARMQRAVWWPRPNVEPTIRIHINALGRARTELSHRVPPLEDLFRPRSRRGPSGCHAERRPLKKSPCCGFCRGSVR